MIQYTNGNALISVDIDGSRVIEFEDQLKLDFPLNIDIRVSTQCSFGQKPDGKYVLCNFCHESAKTDGVECDYNQLKDKLVGLPKGIELAIGSNNLTDELYDFIVWCYGNEYIVNLTINQGHLKRDLVKIRTLINCGFVKGLGVSYRSDFKFEVPQEILDYNNTVFHVIIGIDSFDDVLSLKSKGVKKILLLGEKNFGFNIGNVDLTTTKHKEWFWWVGKMFNTFNVVSFDNLALEQLKLKRFFTDNNWETFNQMENSFYINAVDQYFSPSSRSSEKSKWTDLTVKEYFNLIKK